MEFTFGIITAGGNESMINLIIDSIEKEKIPNYEIIIVGDFRDNRNNTKVIKFDENVKHSWITKKKNIITENSKYENIVFLHDYIVLGDKWYEGQLLSGENFKVRMDKILNFDNSRFRDWCIYYQNNNEMDTIIGHDCLIPYDITHLSKYMYISGAYWITKKSVMLEFPLNENLSWGQAEDVLWSMQVRNKYEFDMNTNSTVKIIKEGKDRVFNEPNDEKITILKNYKDDLRNR